MFDDIICDIPLPVGRASEGWQTKDLGEDMNQYRITADGMLVADACRVPPTDVKSPWLREFCFYSGDVGGIDWVEYRATLDRGRVVTLALVHSGPHSGPALNPPQPVPLPPAPWRCPTCGGHGVVEG